ncbi:MAG: hypothetical protein J6X49_04750 [Victivallales bacterium]|nr:hypothetical protein [Victivallales bacterium]
MKHILTILFILSLAALADDFTFNIRMDNAQIEEVILGCSTKATDKYDRGTDVYAPPMSMGTAIAGLILDRQSTQILYKDIRSANLPQTWLLDCKLLPKKPLTLKWDATKLPKDLQCTIQAPKQQPQDMRKTTLFKIQENSIVVITFNKIQNEKTSEQK